MPDRNDLNNKLCKIQLLIGHLEKDPVHPSIYDKQVSFVRFNIKNDGLKVTVDIYPHLFKGTDDPKERLIEEDVLYHLVFRIWRS